MNSDKHLEECRSTAALYVLGGLEVQETERFEARLKSGCPLCTAALSEFAEIGDQLAMSVPAQAPPPSLRERVLARATEAATKAPRQTEHMTIVRGNDSPWIHLPIKGVDVRQLLGDKTLLVRMQAGAVYPGHEHAQNEQCYVLEGSVTDSSGITAYAGDFVCMAAGSTHEPIHTETGCVLLIAYTA
ncbi:MAG: cupin domain-containing protein [Acidobacteriaceae bacterium]|nr:cupin domain-containing protein [Acidobacteriaceae bacterium]